MYYIWETSTKKHSVSNIVPTFHYSNKFFYFFNTVEQFWKQNAIFCAQYHFTIFFSISTTFQFLEAEKPDEEASRKQHEALEISMNAQEQLSPEKFDQFCRICCNDSLSNKRKFMELHTLVAGKMDLQVKPNYFKKQRFSSSFLLTWSKKCWFKLAIEYSEG